MRTQPDPGLVAYVTARQHRLVQVAYLVCGDRRLAEDIATGALVAVARRWRRVSQDPDPFVRTRLHHDAVRVATHRRRESAPVLETIGPALGTSVVPDHVVDRADGAGMLEGLPPRQRAVLVLRFFEDRSVVDTARSLGLSARAVRALTDLPARLLPPPVSGSSAQTDRPAVERHVRDLLDQEAADVDAVDLLDDVWSAATAQARRRRHGLTALVTAVAGLLVVAVVGTFVRGGRAEPGPGPGPSLRATQPWTQGSPYTVEGGSLLVGPAPSQVVDLPQVALSVPPHLGRPGSLPTLADVVSDAGDRAAGLRVAAAMLRGRGADHYQPVLLVRDTATLSDTYATVGVDLVSLGTDVGAAVTPLGPRSIDPTGTLVLFVRPRDVVVVDVGTGRPRILPVPVGAGRPDLVGAGFADSGRIVAWSHSDSWSLDADGRAVRQEPPGTTADSSALVTGVDGPAVVSHGSPGQGTATRPVRLPMEYPWGDSVSTYGWVATGGFVEQERVPKAAGHFLNGLFAASLVPAGTQRSLVMNDWEPGPVKGGIRLSGWIDDTLLFQYSSPEGTWVLGWGLNRNTVVRVSQVDSSMAGVGSASQVVALWFAHPLGR